MAFSVWGYKDGELISLSVEADATAGVNLGSGERWSGTRISYRRGLRGRWTRVNAIDVHPLELDKVRAIVLAHYGATESPSAADGS